MWILENVCSFIEILRTLTKYYLIVIQASQSSVTANRAHREVVCQYLLR